jgi:hypothetical protein
MQKRAVRSLSHQSRGYRKKYHNINENESKKHSNGWK